MIWGHQLLAACQSSSDASSGSYHDVDVGSRPVPYRIMVGTRYMRPPVHRARGMQAFATRRWSEERGITAHAAGIRSDPREVQRGA
eukprot:764165-Hanusia_phi.AAC.7